ncbi:MAG: homocysteine S-methyltransferase [Gammaproteobacteria bacterium]
MTTRRTSGSVDGGRVTLKENPLLAYAKEQPALILDAGLATALEDKGHRLDDDLWSARLLADDPGAISRAHTEFLIAGADCITTASYQASPAGFNKAGLTDADGERLLRRSADLALEARDTFWNGAGQRRQRIRPLVAASIGPYGAYLADGSEYTGDYRVSDEELREFHQRRWDILNDTRVDLFACETIPSRQEAQILLKLLAGTGDRWAWLSFSCQDDAHLCDGSRISDVASECHSIPQVAAIGVNCCRPEFVSGLIHHVRQVCDKPIIVYPNSGETYCPTSKDWRPDAVPFDLDSAAVDWLASGAIGIGGCCRVHSADIAGLRDRIVPDS